MTKIASIRKIELTVEDNHVTYLVRNVGKRAIVVRLKNSGFQYTETERMHCVVACAQAAVKKGWKRIVANYIGEILKFVNWSTYYEYDLPKIHTQSIRLGHVKTILEKNITFSHEEAPSTPSPEHSVPECILCSQNIQHSNCDNGH